MGTHGNHKRRSRGWAVATVAALVVPTLVASGAAAIPVADPMSGSPPGHSSAWSSTLWSGTTGTAVSATLADVRTMIGASTGTAASLTGSGVGIALIDTGVGNVAGIPAAQLVNGPDLSFESQSANTRYLDSYGHGTHMAGIIIANDTATGTVGLAPKAKVTSIKVGTSSGAVDISQVIAAIDWVVEHRNDDAANPIRVINLSYGTGGNPVAWTDPVQFAAEQAWKAGIVVIAAAGNDASTLLNDPANDPYVVAVGSASTKGTVATADDDVSTFTNIPSAGKPIDVVAPGEGIVSLRDPGSNIDLTYPAAKITATTFRGSGTSQATAVTSAAVALLLQAKPSLTPDQVKNLLMYSGSILTVGTAAGRGYREVNVSTMLAAATPATTQTWLASSGTGTLEAARGTSHVVSNSKPLSGESTVWGALSTATWAPKSAAQTAWVGGLWMGYRLTGDGWTGSSWASKTWASAAWTTLPWDGTTAWTDASWVSHSWVSHSWVGGTWVSHSWVSDDWASGYWR